MHTWVYSARKLGSGQEPVLAATQPQMAEANRAAAYKPLRGAGSTPGLRTRMHKDATKDDALQGAGKLPG